MEAQFSHESLCRIIFTFSEYATISLIPILTDLHPFENLEDQV